MENNSLFTDHCIKLFTALTSLNRHIDSFHQGQMDKGNSANLIMKQKKWIQKCEIENKCDICEKLFSSKQILKDHIACLSFANV